jgi:hypothetical protein
MQAFSGSVFALVFKKQDKPEQQSIERINASLNEKRLHDILGTLHALFCRPFSNDTVLQY